MRLPKKGFLSSYAVNIIAYVLWALLILIFFLIIKTGISPVTSTITAQKMEAFEIERDLRAFLHKSVEVEGMQMKILDIIPLLDDPKYKLLLGKEEGSLFRDISSNVYKDSTTSDTTGITISKEGVRVYKTLLENEGAYDISSFKVNDLPVPYYAGEGVTSYTIQLIFYYIQFVAP